MTSAQKAALSRYIHPSWLDACPKAFDTFLTGTQKLLALESQLSAAGAPQIIPSEGKVFKCLSFDFAKLKVVILGGEPYNDGSATGLCYDNFITKRPLSPALFRILTKIETELGVKSAGFSNRTSYLEHLPDQGVLLMNMSLTAREGHVGAHAAYWKIFTQEIILALNQVDSVTHIQWGSKVQRTCSGLITNSSHSIIQGPNPSPKSGSDFNCHNYFSSINQIKW